MQARIGINGFGRIGRLLARALLDRGHTSITHINDPACKPDMAAHLLAFDSSHGRWNKSVEATASGMTIGGRAISMSQEHSIEAVGWGDKADIVIDCSGRIQHASELQPYLLAGVQKAILSAPLSDGLNIVMGVNDRDYVPAEHHILTAASCTTNCLAVVAKVIHEEFLISHGFITTIHAITNDQSLLDQAHSDWRRGRSASASLIPTTSGFAKTIGLVIPGLSGRLDGYAVRAPVTNASLIDCAFVLGKATNAEAVNAALAAAAQGALKYRLSLEPRPLVSADFLGNTHSAIVDSALTRVMDGHLLKLVAWYDNETGYVTRLAELAEKVASSLDKPAF